MSEEVGAEAEAADEPAVAEEAGTAVEPPVTEAEAANKPAVAEAEAVLVWLHNSVQPLYLQLFVLWKAVWQIGRASCRERVCQYV